MKRLLCLAIVFSAACAAQVSGNAKKLQGKTLCSDTPVDTSVLTYSSSRKCWVASGAGAAGPTGAAGADGTNGKTVLSGSGAPSGGANGDFWVDTTAHCIYGPKASGTWPASCVSMTNGGSTSSSSALILPELGSNGTNDTRIYGADSQSSAGCIVWPVGASTNGQVAADSNTTATMTDGKTCRVLTWQTPSGGGGGTPMFRAPVAIDDSTGWSDYGATTGRVIDTSNTGLVIISSAMGTASKNMQGRTKAATPPFDRVFAIMPLFGNDSLNTASNLTAGVIVIDGGGKSVSCALEAYSNRVNFQGFENTSATATSALLTVDDPFSDVSTVQLFPLLSGLSTISYFRLSDIASTLKCQWSPDGYSWLTVWSMADTAFLATPTGVGYFVDANNQSVFKSKMIVRSYEALQ